MVDYSRFDAVAAESDSDDGEVRPAIEFRVSFGICPRSSSGDIQLRTSGSLNAPPSMMVAGVLGMLGTFGCLVRNKVHPQECALPQLYAESDSGDGAVGRRLNSGVCIGNLGKAFSLGTRYFKSLLRDLFDRFARSTLQECWAARRRGVCDSF